MSNLEPRKTDQHTDRPSYQSSSSGSYPEPAVDLPHRSGNIGLVVLLVLVLAGAAVGFAFLGPDRAQPLVLPFLALFALIGVVALFGFAIGFFQLAARQGHDDVAKAYMDGLADGALIVDKSGAVLYANAAYTQMAPSGADGKPAGLEQVFSGDPEAAEALYRLSRAASERRVAAEEIRIVRVESGETGKQQVVYWYRIRVWPLETKTGPLNQAIVWQISDISRDRERQENVFQELQLAIDYLDHAPAGFFSATQDGKILYINATLVDWLGYDLADFEAGEMNLSDIVSGNGMALLAGGSQDEANHSDMVDLDFVKRGGQIMPVRLMHRVPHAPDGTRGASRTLVLNRSAGEDVSEELRASEVRFSRFFNNSPLAIATLDDQRGLKRMNAPFVKLFDASLEEMTGKDLVSFLPEGERTPFETALAAAFNGQSKVAPVNGLLDKDGNKSARFFMSAVEKGSDDGEAAIVYAMDTTEQRALEVQFAQGQKMQAVGQLAGGVAHDFNNVLTAIIGFSDLLLANHRPSDPSFQDIMNIKSNANRAAGLVRQLLAFSRKQTLRPQVLALGDVVNDLTVMLRRLLGEPVELKVVHGRDLWPVKVDINQLEQVIVNLAVNARDAMPDGGKLTLRTANISPDEAAAYQYSAMPADAFVLIEVTDTGTGMPQEVKEKIFEPFFSTKDVGKGTGLGLSTVYGIVKQTGGFIYVESEEGKGTVFNIFLPRHIVTEQTEEAPNEENEGKGVPAPASDLSGKGRILLVEDEEAVRAFGARALKARGYEVHEASSGAEALIVMEEIDGSVDLVVSDVVMPEMDGPTLLGELRKTMPDLKVIFVSGYAEDAFKKNLPEGEKFHFLPKPFSLKDLAKTVKDVLSE